MYDSDESEDKQTESWLHTVVPLNQDFIRCPNLATYLDEDELHNLGHQVVEDFERDRQTRFEWEERTDRALKMALQVTERKTFPWEGAANVKFPLITTAAMQYSSRAYPALVNGAVPVACRPIQQRPTMKLPVQLQMLSQQMAQNPMAAQQNPQAQQAMQQLQQMKLQAMQGMEQWQKVEDRADRIARHMSYQLLEEDDCWEEEMDKALLIQCLVGCVFKKSYFDPVLCHNVSEAVSPRDLVVHYYAKSIEDAARVTQIIYLSRNDCYERVARGIFCEMDKDAPAPEPRLSYMYEQLANERQGIVQQPGDHQAPYECLEQHTYLDLDGDGYAEPVTVTVRFDTRQVLRIVARFTRSDITFNSKGKVIRIDPVVAYTKYPFIPSPDGGFYDLGFGGLLGPINETIDSAINQLLDAGTLANAGGGFLGRGFRNKKGELRFRPGEWHTVDTTGDDLRKSVLPIPAPQPSPVLFNLLGMLIEYGEQIAGAVDILQGKNPGQNTPAETSRAMVEQGMKVFNGIYKRTHRAFTEELRKLYRLNRIFITDDAPYFVSTKRVYSKSMVKDYQDSEMLVCASADPFYMSDAQRYNQAASIHAASTAAPGYDLYEVNKYLLQSLKVPDVDRFLPDPKGPFAVPPPPNPKVQVEQLKIQVQQSKQQLEWKVKLLDLANKAEKVTAEIAELRARSELEKAQAMSAVGEAKLAEMDRQIELAKMKQEALLEILKLAGAQDGGDDGAGGGSSGVEGSSSNSGSSSDGAKKD